MLESDSSTFKMSSSTESIFVFEVLGFISGTSFCSFCSLSTGSDNLKQIYISPFPTCRVTLYFYLSENSLEFLLFFSKVEQNRGSVVFLQVDQHILKFLSIVLKLQSNGIEFF